MAHNSRAPSFEFTGAKPWENARASRLLPEAKGGPWGSGRDRGSVAGRGVNS